jgi:hypothetical protein
MKPFLLGILAGVVLMSGVWKAVDLYSDFNRRLNYIEGYLTGLDLLLHGQGQASPQFYSDPRPYGRVPYHPYHAKT